MRKGDGRDEDLRTGFDQRRRGRTRWIVLGVLALVLLLFIAQNRDRGEIHFLVWDVTVRVWFALAIAALLGLATGYLIGKIDFRKD